MGRWRWAGARHCACRDDPGPAGSTSPRADLLARPASCHSSLTCAHRPCSNYRSYHPHRLPCPQPGGIRRIIVPVELGYPEDNWRKLGPKPSTFAGDRALDFVLANRGMIDKTLLFDLELVRVDAPKGGR